MRTAYTAGTAGVTQGTKYVRAWLDAPPAFMHRGDKVDLFTKDGAPAGVGSSMRTLTVQGVGFESPASGVYGYVDLDATTVTGTASTFVAAAYCIYSSTPSVFLFMSGEYHSVPDQAPTVMSSTIKNPYGMKDWFRGDTASGTRGVGRLYNITRTTPGDDWAIPVVLDKYSSGNTTITLDHIDSLLIQLAYTRLDTEKLDGLVLLAAPQMVLKLTQLTATVNRRVDAPGATVGQWFTQYGFDGIWIRHPLLGTPVAIQPVRGMQEDRIYVLRTGVLELIQPGGINWFEWAPGVTWFNESYTSGSQGGLSRSLVMRADRTAFMNTMIRVPKFCGALMGVKPS
ncbi:hypothetical protein IMZ48_12655 [Candidatus Bathyarchaeota archaeon]|nr:hypothetical protein [Candidatus Bathyarchaeota archaeon]